MSTTTTNFGFTKPGVNDPVDANQWGFQLNTNLDLDDTLHNRWLTTDIGTSRPADAKAGTMWIDNTNSPWILYVYDGTNDIQIGTIDTTNNQFNPSNASNPTIIRLGSDYTFSWNTTGNSVTGLSFPTVANGIYSVKIFGTCQPSVAWSTNANVTSMILSPSTNCSLYGGGFRYTYANASATYQFTFLPPDTTLNNFTLTNAAKSGASALISFACDLTIQAPNVDSTFQVLASWVTGGGTSSGSMSLKTGTVLTYQKINT